ncbi:MAG: putative manganese transporter, partial [Pygmaiobacter massiliensis]|nr:putative manganese transporter [Pygmaiobacter massiliensis]
IFLSNPSALPLLGKLLIIKFCVALIVGFVVDYLLRGRLVHSGLMREKEPIECPCTHEEGEESVFKAALLHTAQLLFWILLFSLLIHAGMEYFGSDLLSQWITSSQFWQPALAALVGLIPNCAASVLLAQLYLAGSITFASLTAGLCSAAGIGLVVLFKTNKSKKKSLAILAILYLASLAAGLVIGLLGF